MSWFTPICRPTTGVAFFSGGIAVATRRQSWLRSARSAVVRFTLWSVDAASPSSHESNSRDEQCWTKTLRDAAWCAWPTPIAVTLPSEAVELAVMEMATIPENKVELEAVLRWRMQQSVARSFSEAQVSYRVYYAPDAPPTVLAAFVQPPILERYLNCCRAAGLLPVSVGVSVMHFLDRFITDITSAPTSFLTVCQKQQLVVVALHAGRPVYIRTKPLVSVATAPGELTATLQYYVSRFPEHCRSSTGDPLPVYVADSTKTLCSELDREHAQQLSVRTDSAGPCTVRLIPLNMQAESADADGVAALAAEASISRPKRSDDGRRGARSFLERIRVNRRAAQRVRCRVEQRFELRSIARARRVQWSMVGIMVASLGITGWWWWSSLSFSDAAEGYERAASRAQEEHRAAVLKMKQDGLTFSTEELEQVEQNVAFVTQLAEKRTFVWTRLLSDLEEALPEHVTLLAVTPEFKNGSVSVHGAAKTLLDLHTFVSGLQKHPAFHRVVLSQHRFRESPGLRETAHRSGQEDSVGQGISSQLEFSLTAEYQPAS